jgi:site-specific DNA recombinase
VLRFAFSGRVSTEDHQDEHASRGWQLRRATQLIEPHGHAIVEEFFDVGQSRSIPWPRRPESMRLPVAAANPNRGWEALVIGEPHRAFYGDQFQNTFPTLHHHGIELWVPEVGGRVDPESEAHDLLMVLFGGMSKGERNRIKLRVRAAMADLTEREGRYLGGRPPYGYRLVDVGPHPNPEKASMGMKLRRLDVDPETGPIVARIFDMYLGGAGYRAIAQALTDDGIPSPSQHDPGRNSHRTRHAWAGSAVRAILTNPRYLGRQVWGRQPRKEVLLDPNRPADGYNVIQSWAPAEGWSKSDALTHTPLVDEVVWHQAQALLAKKGQAPTRQERVTVPEPGAYLMTGLVRCGICGRKMAGHRIGERRGYTCRIRADYATPAGGDGHPRRLFVSERALARTVDDWLAELFAPDQRQIVAEAIAGTGAPTMNPEDRAVRELGDIERRIERLLDAVESGTLDSLEVAERLRRLRQQRDEVRAEISALRPSEAVSATDVLQALDELGGLVGTMEAFTRENREAIYKATNLRITYHPAEREVDLALSLAPGGGANERVGGGT